MDPRPNRLLASGTRPWTPSRLGRTRRFLLVGGDELGGDLLELHRRRDLAIEFLERLPSDREEIIRMCRTTDFVGIDDPTDLDQDLLNLMAAEGAQVTSPSDLYELLTGKLPSHLCGSPDTTDGNQKSTGDRLSRIFSVVSALLGILLTLPFYPLIALAIWLEDPGWVFYLHERLGRGGRRIRLLKFRTMKKKDDESRVPDWLQAGVTQAEAHRVTRVGLFLRRHRLDELPQFFNVVMGDLNAVGPRAEGKMAFQERIKVIPGYESRLTVMPGMAGWGLMHGYEDVREKLQFDMFYVKHRSFVFDLYIFLGTAWRIVCGTLK